LNTQEYIESGKLEAYLIGITSDEDTREVETMVTAFPEISIALSKLEGDISTHFMTNAITPPPVLKEKLATDNRQQAIKKWDFNQQRSQAEQSPKENYIAVEFDDTYLKVHKYWRPAFIGVFILSKILLATAIYFYFKADSVAQENKRLKEQIELNSVK
jgi:hypothetical protein